MGGGTVSGVSKGYRCGVILDDTAAGVDRRCGVAVLICLRLGYGISDSCRQSDSSLALTVLQNEGCDSIGKSHFTKCAVDAGITERHGEVERLGGISVVSGYGLGNGQIAVRSLPATVKNRIRIQNRTVHIRHCTCGIRVPAIKGISLVGILLCFRRICSASTNIIIRRGCYIGGVIRADPLILDFNSRYVGHPVGLSCRLALSNGQTLRHFPARDENTVRIGRRRRSFTACVRRITNKLRTDFGILYRAILAVDLNRFYGACARIRGDHIDITAFFWDTCSLYQVDVIVRADLSIIPKIEGSSYKNTVT